jgi:hypothetical protein
MGQAYKATFPAESKVRVISSEALEIFAKNWKYHHKLQDEQMKFAGASAFVEEVSFYRGGGQLYKLENLPGIWNEPCLESATEP